MTQLSKVRNHLKAKGSITSWDAIHYYRITRLAHLIWMLRDDMNILTFNMPNKSGKGTHAKYVLKVGDKE